MLGCGYRLCCNDDVNPTYKMEKKLQILDDLLSVEYQIYSKHTLKLDTNLIVTQLTFSNISECFKSSFVFISSLFNKETLPEAWCLSKQVITTHLFLIQHLY